MSSGKEDTISREEQIRRENERRKQERVLAITEALVSIDVGEIIRKGHDKIKNQQNKIIKNQQNNKIKMDNQTSILHNKTHIENVKKMQVNSKKHQDNLTLPQKQIVNTQQNQIVEVKKESIDRIKENQVEYNKKMENIIYKQNEIKKRQDNEINILKNDLNLLKKPRYTNSKPIINLPKKQTINLNVCKLEKTIPNVKEKLTIIDEIEKSKESVERAKVDYMDIYCECQEYLIMINHLDRSFSNKYSEIENELAMFPEKARVIALRNMFQSDLNILKKNLYFQTLLEKLLKNNTEHNVFTKEHKETIERLLLNSNIYKHEKEIFQIEKTFDDLVDKKERISYIEDELRIAYGFFKENGYEVMDSNGMQINKEIVLVSKKHPDYRICLYFTNKKILFKPIIVGRDMQEVNNLRKNKEAIEKVCEYYYALIKSYEGLGFEIDAYNQVRIIDDDISYIIDASKSVKKQDLADDSDSVIVDIDYSTYIPDMNQNTEAQHSQRSTMKYNQ